MTAWMTHEQALRYAVMEAHNTQRRYRVYKSRSVVGWWNAVMTGERLTDRAANTRRP